MKFTNIKKKIAVALLGATFMGAVANMPAVKVGELTIGTEQVSANTWGHETRQFSHTYHTLRGGRAHRWHVYNVYRNGRFAYRITVYGGWFWSAAG